MTAADRSPGLVFGEVADDYDRVRLSYPDELFDAVLALLDPGDEWRALEVGAGTGKATVPFVEPGVAVVALEPDPAMAAALARHVAGSPNVLVECRAFEDYRPVGGFDLLFSADAWHWTQPATRWSLAAQALVPGGRLALFGHHDRLADPAQRHAMLAVFAEFAPTIVVRDEPVDRDPRTRWPGDDLAGRPEFGSAVARVFPDRRTMSGPDYVTYVSTRSQVRLLTPPVRERMLAALSDALGDEVPLTVDTVLHLAVRRLADQ